jgi:glutaryl-CoA dehydrogenase
VQFGVPIASKQLVQRELVDMAAEIARGAVLAFHLGRQKDAGRLSPQQVSLLKKTNVAGALSVARRARALLGANGVLVESGIVRHMLNLESVYTYEGTDEVHTLILGRALTGLDAF